MPCFRYNFPGGSLYQNLLNPVPELALTGSWPLPGTPLSYDYAGGGLEREGILGKGIEGIEGKRERGKEGKREEGRKEGKKEGRKEGGRKGSPLTNIYTPPFDDHGRQ